MFPKKKKYRKAVHNALNYAALAREGVSRQQWSTDLEEYEYLELYIRRMVCLYNFWVDYDALLRGKKHL